jgi:quinol-cytochrome oxidoreductase complex cytochrome b subunit
MLGTKQIDAVRSTLLGDVDRLRTTDWRQVLVGKAHQTTRAVLAGIGLDEARAILRGDPPTEKPNPRYKSQVKSFLLHLRPKYYQRASTSFTHTFRLGWLTTYFFVIEIITGIFLMIFYTPSPQRAYLDMLEILSNVPFGLYMRDMHRLAAEGMVAAVSLHALRVFLTGSYKHPRQFTWLTGVVLLITTLFLSFSGYLLPWDQLAYWAVTIGTSMAEAAPIAGKEVNLVLRGAPDIGAGGLLRFYLLHIFLLPIVAILFISIHYYKVAREHFISLPASVEEGDLPAEEKKHAEERIDLIPNLLIHELMLVSLGMFILTAAVAFFFHAPLENHANPFQTPLHTKAPWYFLWLQGMLKLGNKTIFGVVLPTVMFGLLFVVPYVDRNPHRLARRRPFAVASGLLFVLALAILTYMGTPGYGIETPPAQNILSHMIPGEGVGPVRSLPFEELEKVAGTTYVVTDMDLVAEPETGLGHVLMEFKAAVEREPVLVNPEATVEVALWQKDLIKVRMEISWTDPDEPTDRLEVGESVYVHRLATYDEGGGH